MTDTSTLTTAPDEASFGDYVALLKPRVMSLVVFTALVGMLVAPVPLHPMVGFAALLFIALGAGASGALNMWWDADVDAVMRRTRGRPVPSGAVAPDEALAIGLAEVPLGADAPLEEAHAYAARLAAGPGAVRRAPRLLRENVQRDRAAALDAEVTTQLACLTGPDFREAVAATLERREPVYVGR